jgi:hypothetical protein
MVVLTEDNDREEFDRWSAEFPALKPLVHG